MRTLEVSSLSSHLFAAMITAALMGCRQETYPKRPKSLVKLSSTGRVSTTLLTPIVLSTSTSSAAITWYVSEMADTWNVTWMISPTEYKVRAFL